MEVLTRGFLLYKQISIVEKNVINGNVNFATTSTEEVSVSTAGENCLPGPRFIIVL